MTDNETVLDHTERPAKPGLAASSRTAEITAAMRAAETMLSPRRQLFVDPYARIFLTRLTYRFLVSSRPVARIAHRIFDRGYRGLNIEQQVRNKYYEQHLHESYRGGTRQIVMVGAGFDTLALRHKLDGATVFEIDAPPTQASKKERLLISGYGLDRLALLIDDEETRA